MSTLEPALDPAAATRALRRRQIVNRLAEALATLAALLAVGVLALVVWSVAKRGAQRALLELPDERPAGSVQHRAAGSRR